MATSRAALSAPIWPPDTNSAIIGRIMRVSDSIGAGAILEIGAPGAPEIFLRRLLEFSSREEDEPLARSPRRGTGANRTGPASENSTRNRANAPSRCIYIRHGSVTFVEDGGGAAAAALDGVDGNRFASFIGEHKLPRRLLCGGGGMKLEPARPQAAAPQGAGNTTASRAGLSSAKALKE